MKNDLEAYSYDMKNKVQAYGELEKYIDHGIRDKFVAEIEEVVEWLYGDGESA